MEFNSNQGNYPIWFEFVQHKYTRVKCTGFLQLMTLIIFRRTIFFGRQIFNSVVGVYSLCPEIAHDAQSLQICAESLVSCILNVLGVIAVHKPEVVGSNSTINHIFTSFRYSLTSSYFLTTKIRVFWTKNSGFLVGGLFFLKNYHISDVTKTNRSFFIFLKFEKIFNFCEKTEKFYQW